MEALYNEEVARRDGEGEFPQRNLYIEITNRIAKESRSTERNKEQGTDGKSRLFAECMLSPRCVYEFFVSKNRVPKPTPR